MNCEIDYCEGKDEKTLLVEVDGEEFIVGLCTTHATKLVAYMSAQTGTNISLHAQNIDTEIGIIQAGLEILDAEMAMQHERGH